MKFLADENIPLKAVQALRDQNLDVISVIEIRRGMSDEEVMALARQESRIIITFDLVNSFSSAGRRRLAWCFSGLGLDRLIT